jgi:hypothetical protein
MSVRLSIHLSVNTTVRLFVCLSIRLRIHPSASQPFRLPNPNVNLPASLLFLLSACLMQVHNSIYRNDTQSININDLIKMQSTKTFS